MTNLETILETLERCNISFYVYKSEEYKDEFEEFEVQDLVISCSTEDCNILAQNHELLIDAVLENYEFVEIIVLLSIKDDWIESFKINYTETDEEDEEDKESIKNEKDIKKLENFKLHRFKTPKKIQSKQKINLILISIVEHFYSFASSIIKILYDS